MSNKKVLLICSVAYSLINFRKDFIEELLRNDFEVWCAAPDFQDNISAELHAMGAKTVPFHLQRKGLNPVKDLKTISELKKIIKDLDITMVFAYTIKPVIYGSLAARQQKIPMFSLITGLGFTFSGVSLKARLLGNISRLLYKLALGKNNTPIFQNIDDKNLFLEKGILSRNKASYVVNGSGINLNRFRFEAPKTHTKNDVVHFIIVGRLMVEKGIELYLKTAAKVRKTNKNAKFHIVGNPPEEVMELSERLKVLHDNGTIIYHGRQADVKPFLYKADVFVLPTYYREGVPRSILEALSVGMPIITTHTPGCKETVIQEKNGFLIPPKQFGPLLDAVTYFVEQPEKIAPMGKASRKLAEEKFDVRLINADLLSIINQHLK